MTIIKESKDINGRFHSYDDGPAVEYSNGDKVWYRHGKIHRENEPAVICSNGDKFWYHHGKLHRDNDPAIMYRDGEERWYHHNKLHRDNGPAVEYSDGHKEWWYEGTKYTLHEWLKLSSLSEEQKTELLLSYDYN